MRATIKREKLLKNSAGQYRYLFNWVGGGFNDIWAKNLKEFKSELKRRFPNSKLEVNYNTLHKATASGSEEWDVAGNMMCW
jgi:hypothetical protein